MNASDLSVEQTLAGAINGLDGVGGVALSGDDRFVYLTGADGNSLSVFERDPAGDALTSCRR